MKTAQNTKKGTINTSGNTAKNNKKMEDKTMKNTSYIYEILRGERELKAPAKKAHRKPTIEDMKRARKALLAMANKKAVEIDITNIEGLTDFDKLANLVTTYYSDIATATKKAVRFKFIEGKIVCWRRKDNIRVYTDNTDLLPLDWGEDNHEVGYTHSTYTDYKTIAKLITARQTATE